MDRTTEPVIAVLGNPIAGNAAQFALQRALSSMQLDWRVLSFNVLPANLSVALDGLQVLGVEGVLIDENLANAGMEWIRHHRNVAPGLQGPLDAADPPPDAASPDNPAAPFDFLYRAPSTPNTRIDPVWSGSHAAAEWLLSFARDHFSTRGRSVVRWSRVGDGENVLLDLLAPLTTASEQVTFEPESADQIDLIAILPSQNPQLRYEEWPRHDHSTLVIDLSRQKLIPESLADQGYRVVADDDIQVGMLSRCLSTWTQQSPPTDVLREAIEEYSAV